MKALEHDWKLFSAWCAEAGVDTLPATEDTLGCYVTYMEAQGLAPNTMSRRVCSVSMFHKKAKLPTPVGPAVWDLLTSVRSKPRREGNRSRAKKTISGEELRKISLKLEGQATTLAIRDRALIVFGFNSAMRRSEISALDLCDVEIGSKGLTTVNILRSKTDQESKGRQIGLFPGNTGRAVRCAASRLG